MQVSLETNEVAAVVDALSSYLSDLRGEINKTEDYDMRQGLKAKEVALLSVVTKLGGTVEGTEGPNLGADNPPWGM